MKCVNLIPEVCGTDSHSTFSLIFPLCFFCPTGKITNSHFTDWSECLLSSLKTLGVRGGRPRPRGGPRAPAPTPAPGGRAEPRSGPLPAGLLRLVPRPRGRKGSSSSHGWDPGTLPPPLPLGPEGLLSPRPRVGAVGTRERVPLQRPRRGQAGRGARSPPRSARSRSSASLAPPGRLRPSGEGRLLTRYGQQNFFFPGEQSAFVHSA